MWRIRVFLLILSNVYNIMGQGIQETPPQMQNMPPQMQNMPPQMQNMPPMVPGSNPQPQIPQTVPTNNQQFPQGQIPSATPPQYTQPQYTQQPNPSNVPSPNPNYRPAGQPFQTPQGTYQLGSPDYPFPIGNPAGTPYVPTSNQYTQPGATPGATPPGYYPQTGAYPYTSPQSYVNPQSYPNAQYHPSLQSYPNYQPNNQQFDPYNRPNMENEEMQASLNYITNQLNSMMNNPTTRPLALSLTNDLKDALSSPNSARLLPLMVNRIKYILNNPKALSDVLHQLNNSPTVDEFRNNLYNGYINPVDGATVPGRYPGGYLPSTPTAAFIDDIKKNKIPAVFDLINDIVAAKSKAVNRIVGNIPFVGQAATSVDGLGNSALHTMESLISPFLPISSSNTNAGYGLSNYGPNRGYYNG